MEEQTKAVQATAEAIKEVAILGQDLVKPATDLCHWFGDVLGTAPKNAVGIILTDPLAHLRIRFGAAWMRRTREILKQNGVEQIAPISPQLLIEAYRGASLNSDDTIEELWARLMAAALDPNRNVSLNRPLIEALKQLDPDDALVFQAVSLHLSETHHELEEGQNVKFAFWRVAGGLIEKKTGRSLRPTQISMAREKLVSVGCLDRSSTAKDEFFASALGIELWLAVRDDGAS